MFTVYNENFKDRIERYMKRQHFLNHNGIVLTDIKPGLVRALLDVKEIHKQQFGLLHGGVIATLADISCGFAAYTLVSEDVDVVTGEIKISYLSKGKGTEIVAIGKVIRPGRKLHFCESEVFSEGKLIAKASSTMICIEKER